MSITQNTQGEEFLNIIANYHINPSESHIVDLKVQYWSIQKLLPYLNNGNVLEMGYGDGMWTNEIISKFGNTSVVDISSKLLSIAKEKHGGKITTYHSYFEEFSPPANIRFSTIIASHILEHVADPVLVMKKMKEWLTPDGIIIVIVPNARSYHRQLSVLMNIQKTIYDFSPSDYAVGHVRVYDLNSIKQDVALSGLRIIYERGFFLKTLPNGMMTSYSDELLKALVDISDTLPANDLANIALILKS